MVQQVVERVDTLQQYVLYVVVHIQQITEAVNISNRQQEKASRQTGTQESGN
jgi:hypothetical protein